MVGQREKGGRVLVVDDEESLRRILYEVLKDAGYDVTTASSAEVALQIFRDSPFPLVITDIVMTGMSGVDLLAEIKQLRPACEVVLMTSHASVDTAISALRSGACDYLLKPFSDIDIIAAVADRAMEKIGLREENRRLMEELKHANVELIGLNRMLKDISIRDALTGLYNRRHFEDVLAFEVLRSRRYHHNFCLLFLDVDHFKLYNDRHGHPEGDVVLRELADVLKGVTRCTDVVARYGGEEFIIILPETKKTDAFEVAENLRRKVADYPFKGRETQPMGKITISIGVAVFPEDGQDGPGITQHADRALYEAKGCGRNAVR
jgi:two-component system, cell cycle response regulator